MRIYIVIICVCLASLTTTAQQPILSLIPWPVEVKQQAGSYLLKSKITVSNSLPGQDWPILFKYLSNEMKKQFGITVTEAGKGKRGDIDFSMKRMPTSGKPSYTLTVSKEGISITSNFNEPAFHAMQTFFQLIPVDPKASKEIPFVDIFDHARFDYRGLHFDVSRHFFSVNYIKRYLDYIALHKMNYFHWHLTDDQGWRIEIKKYPLLTTVGGWRNGTIIGRYPGTGNDKKKYGGFYTQEEIKDVVKYAAERYITIIPEIEMPGHSSAAIAAYPELSCFPDEPTIKYYPKDCKWYGDTSGKKVQQTWGVFDDVYCAGKENTFQFNQDVLDEVMTLFPSIYIHVGGDECPKTNWKRCADCQKRMKDNKLKDEHELQSYFIQRIEKYLNSKGKKLIGWDEILEGGLAPNATVMSWQGEKGGIEAAKQNHTVVMTPGNPVYFDHTQSQDEDSVTIGGYNPIEKVYAYEPVPKELNATQAKYILGAQANMWTEYIGNTKKVDYMLFPRISALSEVLWSPKEKRNWDNFQERLLEQFKRYDQWKVNYSKAYYDLKSTVLPTPDNKGVLWKLESKTKNDYILIYKWISPGSSDGQIVSSKGECERKLTTEGLYYGSLQTGKQVKSLIKQQFSFNKATGKKITLKQEASDKYPGDGAFTLVNGIINEKGFARSREFIGFNGTDCEAVIDLGESQSISSVTINSLNRTASWIWRPLTAEVFGSDDGKKWTSLKLTDDFEESKDGTGKGKMIMEFDAKNVRYVKVVISNWGTIPAGHPGAGSKPWLFVDEIGIEGPKEAN